MNWQKQAINPEPFEQWDRAWRKRLGFFDGLHFFRRTNSANCINIAARHWPHKLCWDWILSWTWAIGPYYYPPWRWQWSLDHGINIGLIIGHFRFQRQDCGHMAALGPNYADAPRVVWKRQITELPPAGNA
jgi:hypothetical protein